MEKTKSITRDAGTHILSESLKEAMTYDNYRGLVVAYAAAGTSTGPEQTEALSNYTLLNHTRMKRLDKTLKIPDHIQEKFKNFEGNQTWLVITESWCGDAAQSMPAMNQLAALAPSIDLKIVLRDENPDLMNAFLTHGTQSIPKLIVIDNTTKEVLTHWGPRPSIATQLVNDFKKEHGKLTPEFKKDLQGWYNKDKSVNIINDLAELID